MARADDAFFGKLVRWLAAHDLEMHTPQRGETYVCKRRPKQPRFTQQEDIDHGRE
jgi:hypothetical protein